MPADFVALDLVYLSSERCEVAAVVHQAGTITRLLFLLGYDELAARARAHAVTAECLPAANAHDVARVLAERAAELPWVTYDLGEDLAAWNEADETGLLAVTPQLDLGDLAALALPTGGGGLAELLAAAGLPAEEPPAGLPRADAIAALWRELPHLIAKRPYAVRSGLQDLLARALHPLAEAWAAGAAAPPVAGEAGHLDSLLRQRLRELIPPATEPAEPTDCRPIDPDEVAAWFGADGAIGRGMASYEKRDGQVQMSRAVAEALNGGHCLLVEAGTGTGKSIAYLAPALRFAVHNSTPLVVSTNTKNLQDQLFAKDLPLLAAALEFEFRAELIKGRGNYLCVEKLLREYADAGLLPFDDQLFYLAYLLSWAEQTRWGDLDDLSGYLCRRYPRLEAYARGLASDSESCTATTARNHPCFATYARRRAGEADLLVVNHALALANATVEVLPPFRHVVFDEAHNLEDIATEAFGLELERRGLLQLLREVGGTRDARSFANRLRRLLQDAPAEVTEVLEELTAAEQAVNEVSAAIEVFGEQLAGLVMARLGRSADELTRAEKLRLDPRIWSGALGESLRVAADNLAGRIGELHQALTRVTVGLQGLGGEGMGAGAALDSTELQALRVAAQARQGEWAEQLRVLGILTDLSDEQYVYWLEFVLRREAWEWRLKAAPIEAGEALAEHVYRKLEAVVLTSATLTVDGRFDYFAHRLGLTTEGIKERFVPLQVPSSFDYQRQVLLGMPNNIAAPNDEKFESHVARAIEDIALLLDGRTLLLFTSVAAMRRAHERLAPRLAEAGIEALCQGVSGSRHALAERFRTQEHAVLFGTRSFWEGIDVPGDALCCVVIVKLPFSVPDDPVHAARCEHLEAQGINAWSAYSVPQAVILFKQGFGRLIRTATDRGAVIVLDRRLRERSYGRAFLRSVPGYSGVFESWFEVKERLREWLQPAEAEPRGGRGRASGRWT